MGSEMCIRDRSSPWRSGIEVAFRSGMSAREMDCPECAAHVPPMQGSTWAIAWYSCPDCGTFWYARLRVGPGSEPLPANRMIAAPAAPSSLWSLEELEAEADALRKESDSLPKGNLEALRLHLEKLKVLADAINQRLDSHAPVAPSPVC